MDFRMLVDSEMSGLSIPKRFFAYSESYGNGAKALTENMVTDEAQATWPNAAVVLMLSVHSVELFLKGAIFSEYPQAKIGHHNIDELYDIYSRIYHQNEFEFDMPFKTEYPGMSEEEVEVLKESRRPTPSVLYRYPTASGDKEWEGAFGFDAPTFLTIISELMEDYRRLRKCIT